MCQLITIQCKQTFIIQNKSKLSCIKKDFTVKVEQEKCEDTCIPNVDDKQKFIDVNVNCNQFSKFRYTLLEEILKKDRVFASKEIKIVFEKFYLFCERID